MKYVEQANFTSVDIRNDGKFVINLDAVELPYSFAIEERSLVHIPSGKFGGNHTHDRTEMFVCLDKGAELHWIDPETQERRVAPMNPVNGVLQAFLIKPRVPHAVVNASSQGINLLEYADGPLDDVMPAQVIQ